MFLTAAELVELTGRRQRAKQAEWLRAHRWRFELTADGDVRVARAYFEKRMCGEVKTEERVRPNLQAVA